MKFVVRSKADMMAATPPETGTWAVISIDEKADFPVIQENDMLLGRLNLQFHDADVVAYEAEGEIVVFFDENHAKQILDFYEGVSNQDVDVIYVHCLMGQSRSAAVAAALTKALTGDDSAYFDGGRYKPNMRVFRGVLNECHARGMIS